MKLCDAVGGQKLGKLRTVKMFPESKSGKTEFFDMRELTSQSLIIKVVYHGKEVSG